MNNLESYLFETKAIKVCKNDFPFWYTSGKIGPYFVNTHFLYGSEENAQDLLNFIDEIQTRKLELPKAVFEKVKYQYENNKIYKNVINEIIDNIKNKIDISKIDYISGGERRDWYFSLIIANLLHIPHITIYKDLTTVVSDSNFENSNQIEKLEDKKVLHIADLVTLASSYVRAWIPAIENLGSKMLWSFSVVDRLQGGAENLKKHGVEALSMVQFNLPLFDVALKNKIINNEQYNMIKEFIQDPDGTMRAFLISHPDFLTNSLNSSDSKAKEKAKLCIDSNIYNL